MALFLFWHFELSTASNTPKSRNKLKYTASDKIIANQFSKRMLVKKSMKTAHSVHILSILTVKAGHCQCVLWYSIGPCYIMAQMLLEMWNGWYLMKYIISMIQRWDFSQRFVLNKIFQELSQLIKIYYYINNFCISCADIL